MRSVGRVAGSPSHLRRLVLWAGEDERCAPATDVVAFHGALLLKPSILAAATAAIALCLAGESLACTRTLYVGADNTVITGRNMDWKEDMASNLWVFPAGMARDGAAGPRSLKWTSKYGSVIVSGYEAGSTDGLNEKGLVANILYLAESQYPRPSPVGRISPSAPGPSMCSTITPPSPRRSLP